MKIIFFGLGQIGKRHLKLLQKHFDFDIYAFRSDQGHSRFESFDNVTEINTWQQVDKIKPDIAFITNPTYLHIQTALQCAQREIKLFIEKPIGHNLELLDDLLLTCKNLITYIAYPFRHISYVINLKEKIKKEKVYYARFVCSTHLLDWRNYSTYSAYAEQGGGAILDLSHEIDLATFLFGEIINIIGVYSKKSDVTYDAEDCADIILEHKNNVTSNIHLDLFSGETRYISIQTEHNYYQQVLNICDDSLYLKQLKYFFDNIDDTRMMNNIHDASDMFRKVIQWKEEQDNSRGSFYYAY